MVHLGPQVRRPTMTTLTRTTFFDRTGLGRSLDPRHPISRRGFIGSIAAGAITLGVSIVDGSWDLTAAVIAGIATFLAWAVTRELDPDRPVAADLAMVVALIATFFGSPSLGAVGVALIALRLVAGTVGRRLFPTDLAVLIAAAVYAGTQGIAWAAGLALLGAVLRRSDVSRWAAAAVGVAGFTAAVVATPVVEFAPTTATMLLTAVAALAALGQPGQVSSATDAGETTIQTHDVRMARLTAASIIVGAAALVPGAGWALAPITAALVGTALPSIQRTLAG